ncbi:MAG: hypothetical protein JSS38_11140 [Nitrospira sp.]|nr:hypothetical protein [Nitrospira sp.]
MRTITVNAATFGAMYDALNIAYERLVTNNGYGTECPYMAVVNDAVVHAEEELCNWIAEEQRHSPFLSGKGPS